jgi:hypothetical protein
MNYEIISQKLELENNITTIELFEISKYILFYEHDRNIIIKYFNYIIEKYNKPNVMIDKMIFDILSIFKDGNRIKIQNFMFKNFKISCNFLNIYYKWCEKNYPYNHTDDIDYVLKSIDNKYEYIKLMTQYERKIWFFANINNTENNNKLIKDIILFSNNDLSIIKYLMSSDFDKRSHDNTYCYINDIINDSVIFDKKEKYNEIDLFSYLATGFSIFNKSDKFLGIIKNSSKLCDDFMLNKMFFSFLLKEKKYNIISDYIINKKIKDTQECFYLLVYHLICESKDRQFDEDIVTKFIKNFNIVIDEEKSDILFEMNMNNLILYLISEKHIIPSLNNFKKWISRCGKFFF